MLLIEALAGGGCFTHLRKLQEAGYVANLKSRQDGPARTAVSLSHAGRAALEQYTATLRQLLDQAARAAGTAPHSSPAGDH